jgi:hypothetical protein
MIMNWAETVDQLRRPGGEHAAVEGEQQEEGEDGDGADDAAQFGADQRLARKRDIS